MGRSFLITPAVLAVSVIVGAQAPMTTLGVSGRSNANVSLASSGTLVAAVWSASAEGGVTDIFAAVSQDGGRQFSAPRRVNAIPGDARPGGEQPPRVALVPRPGAEPEIGVLWPSRGEAGMTLLFARSMDGGRSFGSPTPVVANTPGNRGWHALVGDGQGFTAVWLDHERLARTQSAGREVTADPSDGAALAQLSDLRFARLGAEEDPRAVTKGVCYCCKTALASDQRGSVFMAWRHVYPGNVRDIAFTVSRDGGQTFADPVRVSDDRWVIAGCPDDGPAMALGTEGRIHVVWPTAVPERGDTTKALFYASSADGKRFTPRQRLPTRGVANHPQLTVAKDGSLVVVWDESGDGGRRLAVARGGVNAAGAAHFTRQDVEATGRGVYPVAVATPEGVLLAWTAGTTDRSMIQLRRLE